MTDRHVVFEKTLMYATIDRNAPGSFQVRVLEPRVDGRIPVVIDNLTKHSPLENIQSIVHALQGEIFQRINVDVRRSVDIYIRANTEMQRQLKAEYVQVVFAGGRIAFHGTNEIAE
jgi:hypothetical protein